MKERFFIILAVITLCAGVAWGQDSTVVAKPDSTVVAKPDSVPLWKQKLYYGYNFDIYFHHDSKTDKKENGFSFSIVPELGWRLKERVYIGMRFGGSYENTLLDLPLL